ncbi:MAG TPA: tetratricopeptide repeat protein, partial [Burkholderiaceae bacterium]|nr:tetratricopeptide repeat protein [Burkholderiaceae bacterium]
EIDQEYATAHYNLGNALRDLRRFEEAAASYRSALAFKLDLAEVHNNLGITLRELGQPADAVKSYRRALALAPNYAESHGNLGVALRDLRQLDESITSFRRALALSPGFADAHYNLGVSLANLGQLSDAVTSYRQALAIKPNFPEAHNNLGNALADQGQLDAAIASYRQALAIKPDFPVAHSNLLFQLNYLSEQPAATLLSEARHFGILAMQRATPYTQWRNSRDPHRCLRIGLVSADLRDHPVGYFIEGILAALASQVPRRLEFIAYDNHRPAILSPTGLTERIKACCRVWHATSNMSDEELARQIRADEIDILIDLSGHTADNRLPVFAWKPAPLQISWLGYVATTGLAAIDYLIADPWTMLESEEANFTEKIWRLPQTRLCFTQPDEAVDVSPLPALKNGYLTFGCFNTLTKMNDFVVALWARVLHAVPNSRLFLKAKQLDEEAAIINVRQRFAAHGIDSTRLMLEGPARRSEYLAAYQKVDIALDPFPFPGGATSAEALWMGVPVLSLGGKRFLARQGIGLLMNAGLPEWIAADEEDYVARAVSHAGDLQRLTALRKGMRQQVLKSPLFDAHRFAFHFEAGLHTMWAAWCDQHRGPGSN